MAAISTAAIRGTARTDYALMTVGPLLAAGVWMLADTPPSLGNVFAVILLWACAMVGFVRRLRPWLGIGAIEGGLGLVVSRSVRIPLAWSDLQRAGVFEHGGESGLALELRDPRAFADALQPDVTHDLLRILRRELGRQVVDAERPSLGDSLRRTRDKTGFDLIIPERKLGGATASGAAAAIGQQILKARWDLAMSAGETAAATRDR